MIMAHEKVEVEKPSVSEKKRKNFLLVGPEGGFSESEVNLV